MLLKIAAYRKGDIIILHCWAWLTWRFLVVWLFVGFLLLLGFFLFSWVSGWREREFVRVCCLVGWLIGWGG